MSEYQHIPLKLKQSAYREKYIFAGLPCFGSTICLNWVFNSHIVYAKAVLAPDAYLASGLTESGNALLCLTHVVHASHDTKGSSRTTASNEKSNEDVQHAREYMAAMVSTINDGYVAPDIANLHLKVTSSVVAGNDVAEELLSLAEHGDCAGASKKAGYDMIAMTTHGRSGVQRWATGSVTGRVLAITHCPTC